MTTFSAPWSRSLIVTTVAVLLLCVGIVAVSIALDQSIFLWASLLPLGIIPSTALWTVRSYIVAPGLLLIRRLLWTNRLPLDELLSAHIEPNAMRGSIRLFGIGGVFSWSGLFRNKTLGTYRAFVTDPSRTVVLRFRSHVVVVSPDEPEKFVETVTAARHLSS